MRPTDRPGTATPRAAGRPRRAVVATTAVVLLLVLVALTLALVPLHVVPGPPPTVNVARDFTPGQIARERAFHSALRPPAYGSLLLAVAVALGLGLSRRGSRLVVALARPFGGGWGWQVLLGTLGLALAGRLVTLPLDVRSEQVLRDYGLSTQDWRSWAVATLTSLVVTVVATSAALLAVLALARRAPRTWWAWGAGAVAALVLAGSFVYPVVVQPLFDAVRPLPAGPLRDDLLALARQDHVQVGDVLVADASHRTTALNAYVSGFGATRRIVVYDTLVRDSPPAQVRIIVAHELGHAKRDDVLRGSLLGAIGAAAAVCLLALLLQWDALLARVGAGGPGDARVVPLVLAVLAAGTLLVTPAVDLLSRQVEARADLHALQLTGDVSTFIDSQRRLAVSNLNDLQPGLVATALATHPSGPQRIAAARAFAAGKRAGR